MRAICIDIDNVVAQTDKVMREVIRLHSKDHVSLTYEDVVCFDYWMCRDARGRRFGKNEWPKIHDEEFTDHALPRIEPYPGVAAHLDSLAKRFEVHLATSRLDKARHATEDWLSRYGIKYHSLHFVGHGEKHLIEVPFAAAIDDDREQGYAFAWIGVPVFLLAHPWNHVGPGSPLTRLSSWDEIVAALTSQGTVGGSPRRAEGTQRER